MTSNWKLGLGFTLITVTMWGLLPLGLQGVLGAMDAVTVSWYRFSGSALIALAWYGLRSGPELQQMLRRFPGWSLAVVLGLVGNYLLYIWGLERTTPAAAQILVQLAPLILLLASVFLFREQFFASQWLGVLVFSIGLALFFLPRLDNSVASPREYWPGALMVIAGSFAWALYGVAQKQLLSQHHAKDILLLICLAGTALLLPFAEPGQIFDLDRTELLLLAFSSLNTIVAYGCFGLAMSHWEASKVSAVIPLAPLLTLLFTAALNGTGLANIPEEPLNWMVALGALLVVTGSAVAAVPGPRKLQG